MQGNRPSSRLTASSRAARFRLRWRRLQRRFHEDWPTCVVLPSPHLPPRCQWCCTPAASNTLLRRARAHWQAEKRAASSCPPRVLARAGCRAFSSSGISAHLGASMLSPMHRIFISPNSCEIGRSGAARVCVCVLRAPLHCAESVTQYIILLRRGALGVRDKGCSWHGTMQLAAGEGCGTPCHCLVAAPPCGSTRPDKTDLRQAPFLLPALKRSYRSDSAKRDWSH